MDYNQRESLTRRAMPKNTAWLASVVVVALAVAVPNAFASPVGSHTWLRS